LTEASSLCIRSVSKGGLGGILFKMNHFPFWSK
jgi:hypothetical protein